MKNKWFLLFICCLAGVAGCKKRTKTAPISSLSPKMETEPQAVVQSGEPDEQDPNIEAVRSLGRPIFPDEEQDAGAPKQSGPTQAEQQAAVDKVNAEARALNTTQKAVDAALAAVRGQLASCYEQGKVTSGSFTLSMRLHRAGQVLDSSISGLEPSVENCIRRIVGGIRIQGLTTDTMTITRTFNLSSR